MKVFRSGPVVAGIFVLLTGFVMLAVWRMGPGHVSEEGDPSAALPPITADMSQAPAIEVQPHLDLGLVPNDKPSLHTLRVANKGKSPLTINDIATSCACTTGRIDPAKKTIPAGAEANIDIILDPFRIPGFHSKKTLTIYSNDPKRGTAEVIVEANVQPEFEVVPPEVDFGTLQKGETPEVTMRVRQLQDLPLEVKDVVVGTLGFPRANEHNDLTASVVKCPEDQWKTPGKAEYDVKVQIRPEAHPGDKERGLYLQTTLQRLSFFHIPVKANVVAPYSSVSGDIALRPSPEGPFLGKLTVKCSVPFAIEDLRCDSGLSATLGVPAAGAVTIDISAPKEQVKDPFEGYVLYSVKIADTLYTEYAHVTAKEPKALPKK